MTITVSTMTTIDVGRICRVIPLADTHQTRVVYIDDGGRYVAGTVACRADHLRALLRANDAAEDALAAARSLA